MKDTGGVPYDAKTMQHDALFPARKTTPDVVAQGFFLLIMVFIIVAVVTVLTSDRNRHD
jgi:hypothetical protein